MDTDFKNVGPGKAHEDAVSAVDAQIGTYSDPVEKIPQEQRLPQAALPKAADPSPFKLGPLVKGD